MMIYKIKNWIRKNNWKILRYIPSFLRVSIIRNSFPVKSELPRGFIFKLAENQEELEAAFKLLYEEFSANGYMDKSEIELRITKYHALPGTVVIIGVDNGKVVCTMTVINDSPMGLPTDSTWDLSAVRKDAVRLAEISALAISKDFQGRRGQILLPLCKYMHEYCTKYAGVDFIVISTLDSVKDFYKDILLFEPVGDGKPKQYGFVKDVLAYAQFLNLKTAVSRYLKVYGSKPEAYNLHKFFCVTHMPEFQYPALQTGQYLPPKLSPQLMNYFFNHKLPVLNSMKNLEIMHLKNMYFKQKFLQVIGNEQYGKERSEQRFNIFLKGMLIQVDEGILHDVVILDVSNGGLSIRLKRDIPIGKPVRVVTFLGDGPVITIEGVPAWRNKASSTFGVKITSVPTYLWDDFIMQLDSTFDFDEKNIADKKVGRNK